MILTGPPGRIVAACKYEKNHFHLHSPIGNATAGVVFWGCKLRQYVSPTWPDVAMHSEHCTTLRRNFFRERSKQSKFIKLLYKLSLVNSHITLVLVCSGHENWRNSHVNSRLSTLMQLLFSRDQDMRVDETLVCQLSCNYLPFYQRTQMGCLVVAVRGSQDRVGFMKVLQTKWLLL